MLNPSRQFAYRKVSLPEEIIIFVTSRCNLRCQHCFNLKNLGRQKDLSLVEIEKLAQSLPNLRTLSLSGGEPFLREDLVQICQLFIDSCQLRYLEIPTNGTVPDRIGLMVGRMLRLPSRPHLSISVSLDGLAYFHDTNRGVPGSFDKAVESCQRLLEFKKRSPGLSVNVLTTVRRDNAEELISLIDFVVKELPAVDNFYWGIMRGDLAKEKRLVPSVEQMEYLDKLFLELEAARKSSEKRQIEIRLYALRRQALKDNQQPIPCVAGFSIGVVYDNGDVAPCEMLPSVGNIRENSFPEIWFGPVMNRARQLIETKRCACTHECFLHPSYMTYLKKRPLSLWRLQGFWALLSLFRDRYGKLEARLNKMLGRRS